MSKKPVAAPQEDSIFSDEDWKELLPGKEIKLGSKIITILPLDIVGFAFAVRRIATITDVLKAAKITQSNFSSPDMLSELTKILIDNVPDIISHASSIPVNDLKRLPFGKTLEIMDKVLDVNAESIEGLEKNLPSLVAKIVKMGVATKKAQ